MIKIVIFSFTFTIKSGGIIALYNLARLIDERYKDIDVKIFDCQGTNLKNEIFDKYFINNFFQHDVIDDNTIVIYPEIIANNPLNCKNVIRWILAKLGAVANIDVYKTWNKNDLIYFWQDYEKTNIKNILFTPWINPLFKKTNYNNRTDTCFIIKKGKTSHVNLILSHPENCIEIKDNMSLDEINIILNNSKYFYCYDPYCCFIIYALICGCIPVIYPLNEFSKKEWLKISNLNENGIAYGNNEQELEFANKTINNVNNIIPEIGVDVLIDNIKIYMTKILPYVKHYYNI